MIKITDLAKKFGITRTSILYYEREGVLMPAVRAANGYRWYGNNEIEKLEKIMSYRSFGIPVSQLTSLLSNNNYDSQKKILNDQFNILEKEIQQLRLKQKAIVQFMGQPELLDNKVITINQWKKIMSDAGLDENDMINWHAHFEKTEPEAHLQFLKSLNINSLEINRIRKESEELAKRL